MGATPWSLESHAVLEAVALGQLCAEVALGSRPAAPAVASSRQQGCCTGGAAEAYPGATWASAGPRLGLASTARLGTPEEAAPPAPPELYRPLPAQMPFGPVLQGRGRARGLCLLQASPPLSGHLLVPAPLCAQDPGRRSRTMGEARRDSTSSLQRKKPPWLKLDIPAVAAPAAEEPNLLQPLRRQAFLRSVSMPAETRAPSPPQEPRRLVLQRQMSITQTIRR
ncbi:Inactive rhomboid protein 1 [Galemys pyrenaicus]|uniref:Inactive rhomboid protein 1 n=1 Tax=Galemys pyrenaicus TaxID=202257 RepID=A0A8J6DHU2_GALPY|nr:Inactive rhomboid protein 1 [Galemys pyrenaicus]